MKRKLLLIISILASILCAGCSFNTKEEIIEKTFDKGDFKIILTNEFSEKDDDYSTYLFSSKYCQVSAFKKSFKYDVDTFYEDIVDDVDAFFEDTVTEFVNEKYGQQIEIKKYNNLYYYSVDEIVDKKFSVYVFAKSNTEYWIIEIYTVYENKELMEEELIKYAKSIEVKDKTSDNKNDSL